MIWMRQPFPIVPESTAGQLHVQEWPDLFDQAELGRVGRQPDKADPIQLYGKPGSETGDPVVAGIVQDQVIDWS